MANELTYILGAGASFESMPVVKSFASRFEKFDQYAQNLRGNYSIPGNNRSFLEMLAEKAKKLATEIKAHQSFDTYFKKLFHTNQNSEVLSSKKLLNLYFLWEHMNSNFKAPLNITENSFWKRAHIDKRYDALIAGLLKPVKGKAETYCPINFITWNYDLNLFLSLKNYFNPEMTIGDFLKSIELPEMRNIWKIGDFVTVVNMNGYFYSKALSNYPTLPILKVEIHDLLIPKISIDYFSIDHNDEDADRIRFAWESEAGSSLEKQNLFLLAREKILKSRNVVVIGYTFPLYNRLIDLEYFNNHTMNNKWVTIQDPNANDLMAVISSDFKITKDGWGDRLKALTNCDSFSIPSNIFVQ